MNPYRSYISCRYITFTPFSTRTIFLCLGLTSHMMSTNPPSIFSKMNLSSGMSELRYEPGTLKIVTSIPSCVSMMSMVNRASREMVGEYASYLVMQHLLVRPSTHILPFGFPLRFSFIRFIAHSAPFFCDIVRLLKSSAPITFIFSNFCITYT